MAANTTNPFPFPRYAMAKSIDVVEEASDVADWRRETVETAAARWAREEPAAARRLVAAGRVAVFCTPVPFTPFDLPPSVGLYAAAYGLPTDTDGNRLDGPGEIEGHWAAVLGDHEPLLDDPDLAGLFFDTVREAVGRPGRR
jgi:hypothetical protein